MKLTMMNYCFNVSTKTLDQAHWCGFMNGITTPLHGVCILQYSLYYLPLNIFISFIQNGSDLSLYAVDPCLCLHTFR